MADAPAAELEKLLERHDRERFALLALTEPERVRAQARAYARYLADPWAFLSDCVYTLDQVDGQNPTKPYPTYFPYLEFVTRAWQAHLLLAVPKSRRMTMSWTCIPLYLWDTIFHRGRFNGFVSKKEDDAGELIARAEYIFRHIPEWRIPKELLPKIGGKGTMTKSPPILDFPELNSKLQGFPMGADQLRQFTLSGIFGDECAFWEDAEEFYSATKPTLDGGGRMTLVSSRAPGFFKKIVFDKINAQDYNFPETPPVPAKEPLPGVECWKNPTNKFFVIDLHYTANPAKRGPEWAKGVRNSMPLRQFMREYEKSWQTFEGLPVYGDFERSRHTGETEPELGLPLLLGWDFGLTPACVIGQLHEGNLRLFREFTATNESLRTFAPKIWQWLRTHLTQWTGSADEMLLSFIDPAGFQRAQTDARTCADELRKAGFERIQPGPIDFETRKGAVEKFLIRHTKHGAGLLLDARYCPMLTEGFAGGYQYPANAVETEPSKLRPLKNSWSHCHDALQYLAAGADATASRSHNYDIPAPQYGFQGAGPRTGGAPKGKISHG